MVLHRHIHAGCILGLLRGSVACLFLCSCCRSILHEIKRHVWATKANRNYGLILFATTRGCMQRRAGLTCPDEDLDLELFDSYSWAYQHEQRRNSQGGMGNIMTIWTGRFKGVARKNKPGTCQGHRKQVMTSSHPVLPLSGRRYLQLDETLANSAHAGPAKAPWDTSENRNQQATYTRPGQGSRSPSKRALPKPWDF